MTIGVIALPRNQLKAAGTQLAAILAARPGLAFLDSVG